MDIEVDFDSPGIDEPPPSAGETPEQYVQRLALEKAQHIAEQRHSAMIMGADTTVVLNGESIGKPSDEYEAVEMLERLRGRIHFVATGIALIDGVTGGYKTLLKSSKIVMRSYSDEEIASYVASGEPMDKAGAYAVQDETFRPALDVQGCYLNAVGFPLCEVIKLLDSFGVRAGIRPDWEFPSRFGGCSALKAQEAARQ